MGGAYAAEVGRALLFPFGKKRRKKEITNMEGRGMRRTCVFVFSAVSNKLPCWVYERARKINHLLLTKTFFLSLHHGEYMYILLSIHTGILPAINPDSSDKNYTA